LYLCDEKFVQAKIKETLSGEKNDEKKRVAEIASRKVAEFDKKKKGIVRALEDGYSPDLTARLKELGHEILVAKNMARMAEAELSLAITDADLKTIAAKLKKEFGQFATKPLPDQKACFLGT
jgi:hypothetical protein